MFLSDLSIRRPVFAAVIMITLVVLGVFSYRKLAVDMFPNIDIPIVSITTIYPGASPEAIEREVTKKIEEAVNPIPGVKHVSSYSREGLSIVVIEFNLEVKLNDAAQDVTVKINAVRGELPNEVEAPVIQKLDIGGAPVISLAIRSTTMNARELTELAERTIKRRLENLTGVGKVQLSGTSSSAVNIEPDPYRLAALNMGVNELISGIQTENVNTPLGRITGAQQEFPMRLSGKPELVGGFAGMIVAQRDGRPITLGEVARVDDGIEEQRSLALLNGEPAIGFEIMKQSGANTVGLADAVIAECDRLRQELPAGVTIDIERDASQFIRDAVADVEETLVLGGLLTVFIVFCFLNSWRSTVITGLTLPVSVISAFIMLNALGLTLNILTLMALSLAIGMLIDDAIVVRENIVRHIEMGKDHFTAAREGTAEIGLAVLATSLSIMAVFLPVAFMKGIVGRMFYSFGTTIAFAVGISLLVSFTLDPMLSSRWHDPALENKGRRKGLARWLEAFNDWFERMADRYKDVIGWALVHRKTVLAGAAAAFIGGMACFFSLSGEFMTQSDQGEFQVNLSTAPQASLRETEQRARQVLDALRPVSEIAHTFIAVGAGDQGTVRDGSLHIMLKPRAERERDQFAIQQEVRTRLQDVPGVIISITEAGGPVGSEKPLLVSVRGEDIATLKQYATAIRDHMRTVRGIVDISMDMEFNSSEYRLTVDRARAQDLGLNSATVMRTVSALVGGTPVSTYEDAAGEAREVRVRLPLELRRDPAQLSLLRVVTPDGALLPLDNIVSREMAVTPSEISRKDLSRQIVVGASLDDLPLGDAQQNIEAFIATQTYAPGYKVVFAGEAERMNETFTYMVEAMVLAIILVYLILAAQFESFLAPFAIMLSLPLSIIGMAGLLLLTGDTLNMMSMIGLIMLMGLVCKNAILLIDFTRQGERAGMPQHEAIISACRTRLRPIMMTMFAMVFGMMPLALGIGAGGEFRAPMARAVVGGLVTSTLLTLIVIPVFYTYIEDVGRLLHRWWSGEKEIELS